MWVAGHETDLRDIVSIGFTAVSAGFLGALVPIITIAAALYYGLGGMWDLLQSLSIGIIFAATSVSIPVAMLFERRKMHLRSSKATLGAAVIDDIIAVVIVSVFFLVVQTGLLGSYSISFASGHHHGSIWSALFAMVITFGFLMIIGYLIVPNFLRLMKSLHLGYLFPVAGTIIMLLYFACAELLGGLAGITGAYFAGLFHRMGDGRHTAEKVFSPFVNNILLPLFLGSIGLTLNMKVLSWFDWMIVLGLLFVATVSKLVSCYFSTAVTNYVYGLDKDRWTSLESFLFGASMVARGEVGLVIATIMYGSGFILMHQYVVSVVVIVLTTIVAPMLLAHGFAKMELQKTGKAGTYALDIGMFPVIGTTQMFHIIVGHLQQSGLYSTTISISDGRKIVNLDGENVEIILCSEEGILFKGDQHKIKEIVGMIKQLVVHEVERLSA
jgi:Kef-type K+ transport system membrane component KefB